MTNTYLPVRNGVTVSVAGWVKALRDEGHHVAVWTVAVAPPSVQDVYATRGAAAIAHGFPVPLGTRPPREVVAGEWDVIHAHHPVLLGPSALRLSRRQNAVFAATVHSDYVAYVDSYAAAVATVARPVVRDRMRRFFRSADVVFAPSHGIAQAVASWGVSGTVVPGPYPVDRQLLGSASREEARATLGVPSSTPLALYAGRIAADKHVEQLIDEFEVARATVPNAVLAIVGNGPHAKRVRSRAASLGSAVIIPGEQGPAGLGLWYAAADVFVSASPNEVGPLALIEAGLCGTPAVAWEVPGFRDRIVHGANGLLAENKRGAMGRGMAVLLGDRQRAHSMGVDARERLAEHRPDAAARALVAAYASARERATAQSRRRAGTNYSTEAERS